MELYQLDYVLHEPSEEHGGLYMAEIPELPGCRAWAETAKETLAELSAVAEQFILSYKDRGKPLPGVHDIAIETWRREPSTLNCCDHKGRLF